MLSHIVNINSFFNNQKIAITALIVISFLVILLIASWIIFVGKRKSALDNFVKFKSDFSKYEIPIEYSGEDIEINVNIYETVFDNKNVIANMYFEERRIKNSKIIVENFLELKKIIEQTEKLNFIEGKLVINSQKMTFKFKDKDIEIMLNDIFYYSGFYEPKNNTLFLKINFIDENKNIKIIFQLKYFEDLNTFIKINNLIK